MTVKRESVKVLEECIELQLKKSQDYQNPNSNVKQAMHYRRGVSTIHDIMIGKMYRAQSIIETMEVDSKSTPKFESLADSYMDLINYASFAVSYLRGKMEGQDPDRDMFNRRKIPEFSSNAISYSNFTHYSNTTLLVETTNQNTKYYISED